MTAHGSERDSAAPPPVEPSPAASSTAAPAPLDPSRAAHQDGLPDDDHPRRPFALDTDGPVGVLVLHGFTGSTYSVRDWALALHETGCGVSVPALPGHTSTWHELAETTWQHWYDEALAALRELQIRHERVVVAGFSMGGAVALRLAEREAVDGVIVLNPALALRRRTSVLASSLRRVLPTTAAAGDDISIPGATEHSYDRTPTAGVAQLNLLMREVRRHLGRIGAPVLVLRSRQDHVVAPAAHQSILEGCTGPVEVLALPESFHVATLDREAQVIQDRSRRFVEAVRAGVCPLTGVPLAAASPASGGAGAGGLR